DQVAIQNTANLYCGKGYAGDTPGLYPNPLMPRPSVPELALMHDQGFYCIQGTEYYEKDIIYTLDGDVNFRSLWVSINPDSTDMQSGKHEIGIKLFSGHGAKLLEEEVFTLEVIDCNLPENETYYTNWFHVDCLCDFYKVEPYSDEFYKYFESFVSNAARHRQNMLLIPAFTPPLDTVRGGERRNVQLVDVTVTENGYEFGFERLKKFLDTAVKCGIRYFEHCHLFSQWGAESAPNIYDVNGERIFGWDTPSNGDEYIGFLNAYLKELIAFAKKNGYEERFIFHLSDEPSVKHVENFRKMTAGIRDTLKGFKIVDALSNIEFYTEGFVTSPIPVVYEVEEFLGKCDELWMYYTGAVYKEDYSNRLITITAARTRVLGLQMYRYDIKGFLHWAYNFYYNELSKGFFDPLVNPCGYKNYPGASYLAYPTRDGAVPSICEKLMCEAFDDIRALKLLESYIGKEKVIALCEEHLGEKITLTTVPENDKMFTLRQKINAEIKKYSEV
ncbi:MAG: DUF4091 domain-containing protein, partial [Clostridia bacterium]|nr:DUF4091 domain-containing protein [Clostridia bacterium]